MRNSGPSVMVSGEGSAIGRHPVSRARLIVATTVGNGLEIYDFTVYSFFASLIGRLYFPSSTPFGSLLLAVATFGIGFFMRPLGSIVIGNYADRAGRRAAMLPTIALMALGTALIGLAPTYAQIGAFAPVLIVVGRLLQGFSAGGEVGVSTTLLMESGDPSRQGFLVSWQIASQGAAALAGALSGFVLSHTLTPADLESWGWRVPFLMGLLIGPVGLYIRRALDETHPAAPVRHGAFVEVLRSYRRTVLLGILMIVGGTASVYIVVFYMPTYLIRVLHMAPTTAFFAGCVSGLTLLVGSPIAGLLSDRLPSRKPLVVCSSLLSAVLIYPAFWLLSHDPSVGLALLVVFVMVACLALGAGTVLLLLVQAFPQQVRATGLSVVYGLGVSIFGGFAQFIVTWLISITGNPMSPSWYMVACSGITLVAVTLFREVRTA